MTSTRSAALAFALALALGPSAVHAAAPKAAASAAKPLQKIDTEEGMLKKATALRSKLPELLPQEVWGMRIAYQLQRHEIAKWPTNCRCLHSA
jgi:hypothetical protein